MALRLDGRALILGFLVSFFIADPAYLLVDAARNHSGSEGQSKHSPAPRRSPFERGVPFPWRNQKNLKPPSKYKSNKELLTAIREFSRRCGHIASVYSIGRSVKGVPLMVIEISDYPGQLEPEPAFKYIGNMHGDEPSGRELTLYMAEWLCANYLKDPLATLIVKNVHLHLLPSMNPDGFAKKQRNNANDVDLNRDFPDQFNPINDEEFKRQPETCAVMKWVRETQFAASASLHEGALVASYGWDGTLNGRAGYAASPDDTGLRHLASLYSQFNPSMKKNPEFNGGITNGAAWYPLYGGMQDWNYIHGNCFEITLEMNTDKWPDISKIPKLWNQHQRSMLELVASLVKSGVHGRVISSEDGRPLPAQITVKGNSHTTNASHTFGDFHRILPPGKSYELTAEMDGYFNRTTTIILPLNKAIIVDFILDPEPTDEVFPDPPPPKLETCRRNPVVANEDGMNDLTEDQLEKLAGPCLAPGEAPAPLQDPGDQQGAWLSRKYMRSSWDPHGRMVYDGTVMQLRIISASATVVLLSAVLFVFVRWKTLRSYPIRHYLRRI